MVDGAELKELMAWYKSQCDGDWEHKFVIRILTQDNPGWSLEVPLTDTYLEDHECVQKALNLEHADDGSDLLWYRYLVEKKTFKAYGDSARLPDLIRYFLEFSYPWEDEDLVRERQESSPFKRWKPEQAGDAPVG